MSRFPSRREVARRWKSGEVAQMMRNARPHSAIHTEFFNAISVPLVWSLDSGNPPYLMEDT